MVGNVSNNDIISMSQDWGRDTSNGLPYSGRAVQKFIKEQIRNKMGVFYYDPTNNRYLVFADEESKDKYLSDTTQLELILGTFDAPFEYSAEITLLSSAYNAIQVGVTGNYIDFTFDVKNKNGSSTGESVNVTYTFTRNASKVVVKETRKSGESVHFNIDDYLLEGTNIITVSIVGQNSLAATTAAITYQVVNLTLVDEMNIAKVYNLSDGESILTIPYTLSGQGTKRMEWYLNGEKLETNLEEDEVVDSTANKIKYIPLADLSSGVHNLQFRAYTTIGGDKFYTDTYYKEFIVNNGDTQTVFVAVQSLIPSKEGILSQGSNLILYGIEQYTPYNLVFATSESSTAEISLDGMVLSSVHTSSGEATTYTITTTSSGVKTLIIKAKYTTRTITLSVSSSNLDLREITEALEFNFTASGRSNSDVNKDEWSYGDYVATLTGFKWNNQSGWVNGALLVSDNASINFNYAPLSGTSTSTGKTIELEFAAINAENDNDIICDLRNAEGTGLLISASEARLISRVGNTVYTKFKKGERIRVAFVINRSSNVVNKGLVFIYINGVISGATNYGSADNFLSSLSLAFTGSSSVQVALYAVRVYNTALSSSQILNNYIIYRDNINDMRSVYDRNDILVDGAISMDKARRRLPVMLITGNLLELDDKSDTDYYITADIDYFNDQDPTKNFRIESARIRIQGTSSRFYPRKNYRFYTNKADYTILYDADNQIVHDGLYAFKDNAQPVDCWCLKADFAESSGTHNTGVARIWNEVMFNANFSHTNNAGEQVSGYPLRTNAQNKAKESGYTKDVRTTIDGFPILLFRRETSTDDAILVGKYNFNNDKSTPKVFGFEDIPNFDDSKVQSWEFLENEDPIALFQTVDGFYDNATDADGVTKKRWELAFEARHEGSSASVADLYNFCSWVVNSADSSSKFASEKWNHMDVYKVAAYYVYLMRFGALDQVVKNCFLTSEDGVHFYFINYDNDTILGVDNTGEISALPTVDRQSKYANGSYVYAGNSSKLWNALEADAEFMSIVRIVDTALYSAGLTYKNVLEMFNDKQSAKWVERVYNEDAQYKYVTPYTSNAVNYLSSLQGSRKSHRTWWLSKRFALYDSLFASGDFTAKAIEIKCISGTPANLQIGIKSGEDICFGYGLNRVPRETGVYVAAGDSHTFTVNSELGIGTPVAIYAAPYISELNISSFAPYINTFNISNVLDPALGSCLKKLVLGNATYENINVDTISGISSAVRLQELDIRGFKAITSLDLTVQKEFTTLNATNSGLTSVLFAKGAPVTSLKLPKSMLALELSQLPNLPMEGISIEGGFSKLSIIKISQCPTLSSSFAFVNSWFNSKTVSNEEAVLHMDSIAWTEVEATDLIALGQIGDLSLRGRVDLKSITLEQIYELQSIFGQNCFEKTADLFINAPASIFVTGRTKLLEGESEKFTCVVFGEDIQEIRWVIIQGNTSYVSVDSEGLFTTKEGMGSAIVIVRVQIVQSSGVSSQDITINVSKRVYPSSSQFYISGDGMIEGDSETYKLNYSIDNVTGDFIYDWFLSEELSEVLELTNLGETCVLTKKYQVSGAHGLLSLTLKKRYNNSNIGTVTFNVSAVDDTIAETDIGVVTALYNAGLCASPNAITKNEAALITDSQISGVFSSQKSNIKSFLGFKYFTSLLHLPESLFMECSNMESITLPSSLTSIKNYCFFRCAKLKKIELPDGVVTIGKYAFSGTALEEFIVSSESKLESYGEGCFESVSNLKSLYFPLTFKQVNYSTFRGTLLQEVYFETMEHFFSIERDPQTGYIGSGSTKLFIGGVEIINIVIPDSADLKSFTLYGFSSIKSINTNSVYRISPSYIDNLPNLERLIAGKGLRYIDKYSYTYGYTSFCNCPKLKYFEVVTDNPYLDTRDNCNALINTSNILVLGGALSTVPESVSEISEHAFYGRSINFESLPSTVTLKNYCFAKTDVEKFTLAQTYHSGIFRFCSKLKSLTFGANYTSVGQELCENCTSLTEISIPSNVTVIRDDAFRGCTNLKTIYCYAKTAPSLGDGNKGLGYIYDPSSIVGYNTRDTGENILYVPQGATGYDSGTWYQVISKSKFTVSYTL